MGIKGTEACCLIQALCHIVVGDHCIVNFPYHNDADTQAFSRACHGKKASIANINSPASVNIRMLEGEWEGRAIEGVKTSILQFGGVFVRWEASKPDHVHTHHGFEEGMAP